MIIRMTEFWTMCTQNYIAMRNLNCAIWMIRITVFWTMCTQNYIAMRNLKCAIQMMVRTIIWIAHFKLRIYNVILRTHGPKYRHSNDHSNCAIQMIIQIAHFCSRVKTVQVPPNLANMVLCGSYWTGYQPLLLHSCSFVNYKPNGLQSTCRPMPTICMYNVHVWNFLVSWKKHVCPKWDYQQMVLWLCTMQVETVKGNCISAQAVQNFDRNQTRYLTNTAIMQQQRNMNGNQCIYQSSQNFVSLGPFTLPC